jgi:hypothetical protein
MFLSGVRRRFPVSESWGTKADASHSKKIEGKCRLRNKGNTIQTTLRSQKFCTGVSFQLLSRSFIKGLSEGLPVELKHR